MKYFLVLIMCFSLGLYTGMIQPVSAEIIEYPDDDRYQMIPLDCSGADSVTVGFSFNGSPYLEYAMAVPAEIVPIYINEFIQPDTDENGRSIPGHYEGDSYYYVVFRVDGLWIAPTDTFHIIVNYDIGGGCSAPPIID